MLPPSQHSLHNNLLPLRPLAGNDLQPVNASGQPAHFQRVQWRGDFFLPQQLPGGREEAKGACFIQFTGEIQGQLAIVHRVGVCLKYSWRAIFKEYAPYLRIFKFPIKVHLPEAVIIEAAPLASPQMGGEWFFINEFVLLKFARRPVAGHKTLCFPVPPVGAFLDFKAFVALFGSGLPSEEGGVVILGNGPEIK